MSAEPAPAAEEPETPPRECTVCRGTGTVLSNLGGSLSSQPCPWCEGKGRYLAGHDAQAARGDAGEHTDDA